MTVGAASAATGVGRPDLQGSRGAAVWRSRASGLRTSQLTMIALAGAAAAATIGYVVANHRNAAPAGVAVTLRVVLILALMVAGIYGLTGRAQRRMAVLLVGVGFFTCVWLLNGASERVPFSVGLLAAGFAPTAFAFLILAYPSGRLRSRTERWFLISAGGALVVFWTLFVFSSQPPLATGLVRGTRPNDVFSSISLGADGASVLKAGIWSSWTAVTCGTAVLVWHAIRTASAPLRRSWIPIELVAWANAACFLAFLVARLAGSPASPTLGAVYVGSLVAIPIAILIRLGLERSVFGSALARFVERLATEPRADIQALMASALDDPSLVIAYLRPGQAVYVDASGAPLALPTHDPSRAISWIEPARGPVAAVIYDARIADRSAFVHAAGAVAEIRMDAEELEAELNTSTAQLAASRLRLLEAADAERQRIERDLHDGVQQQVVGVRLKLDLASETMKVDPARGERMLAAVGRDVDDMLGVLRGLAKGIYPSILKEHGLRDAISSVALGVPVPVSVSAKGIDRYEEEVEVAIYFTCAEALQNVVKHAGRDARAYVVLYQGSGWLRFKVRDSGVGFDAEAIPHGSGMINMADRIEAIGGRLWVISQPGRGTSVIGRVPVAD